jgi:uncharacterized protein YdeI (YjbR/CyaY-like superfamily)
MATTDPRIDAYIAKSAEFARPILTHLRKLIHTACPDVEETLKWSFPHFTYRGVLCSMAAFKQHCAFGFWHKGMADVLGASDQRGEAMGNMGRITSDRDLPPKATLTKWIKQAMKLNESGAKPAARPAKAKKPPRVPADLQTALRKHKRAEATFQAMSASHQREYVEWITEAKRAETRQKRLDTALEWLAEGKPRNWTYERK